MTQTLIHEYSPVGNLAGVFSCREPELLVSGPAGTGKSRACLEKLHRMMLLNSGAKGLIVRKTAKSLTSSALQTFDKQVIAESKVAGHVTYYGGSAREPAQYRYTNGSTINVAGMDNATKIMSSEYDVIYVQEAIELSESDWEMLTTRLRNGRISFQQLLADCNPDMPTHWLKARCDRGTTRIIESRHRDNPTLYRPSGEPTKAGARYLAGLDNLTGVRRARLRDGLWVSAEGIIYEDFDAAIHVLPSEFPIPANWARYWSIDFGHTHPFVCQRWAEDNDGRLYLYAETFHTKRTADIHARNILKEVAPGGKWKEPKPQFIVADYEDAAGRDIFSRTIGMGTRAAKKDVMDGIEAVQRRFRVVSDGKPRIYFLRNAVRDRDAALTDVSKPASTLEELPGYVWNDKGKEAPRKEDDDGMDAMRYLVAEKDLRGEYRIRHVG